jgi:hypothetical protein
MFREPNMATTIMMAMMNFVRSLRGGTPSFMASFLDKRFHFPDRIILTILT